MLNEERISPNARGVLRALARHRPDPAWTFAEHRERFEQAAAGRPLAEGVTVTPWPAGGGRAESLVPAGQQGSECILYLHGGGFVMGSLTTTRPLAAQLALVTGRRVVSVDYSLAPEATYPTQLDEIVAAYTALRAEGPAEVVLAGDSAGAALAVTTAVRLRDTGLPLPCRLVLLSPLLDLTLGSATLDEYAEYDPQGPRWLLDRMCTAYLGTVPRDDPHASPLHADLRRLPPTLVQTGELEGLRDDADRFAVAATAAGVRCELTTWPGLFHVWHQFAPRLPEARDALETVGKWLGR
ncbi:alpha/beta hydrolase [Pseudonocardia sp. RS010]|uniref:alpha/beta hydrolase n=1 Tax=Pseudonocardia sp. RS010 TaxID=3385979 RepID=UPI0039A3EDF1